MMRRCTSMWRVSVPKDVSTDSGPRRKKRRYGTPGASTSQRRGDALAQEQPPPPPPTPPPMTDRTAAQIDPADPPQQGDNVGREDDSVSSEVGVVGIVEASELGGGYGGFGASGLGAYRGESSLGYSILLLVEDVEADCKAHKSDCEGKQADPLKVLERVRKKSHRQVELLSPIPKPPSPKKRRKRGRETQTQEKKRRVDKAVELRNELASRNQNGARGEL
ncbi:hypothetical protein Sjap_021930 [Stephania japonica]|uniref:Uncharacterized protein n=1 Tax=Stephania japonica TaxID=461633 RepID=A0AAP0HPE8_9MAGN